jgi:hypothetical protein
MSWIDVGSPAGQGDENSSVPVVLSNDQEALLSVMAQALLALASAKGILSDLRVSVINTPATTATVAQGTGSNLKCETASTSVIGQLNTLGAAPLSLNNAVPNWQNQTATQAFTQNIVRS